MQKKSLSSISLGITLAAALVLVASCAQVKPAEPSSSTDKVNKTYLMDPTIIAVDIDTWLAFMCGLTKDKVFFKYDSEKLLPDAKERLERIATCAKTGPVKGMSLLVVGRTDPRGSGKYNKQLGKRRAEAVAKYLIELGVAQIRVETESKGETSAHDAYSDGWPYNRRVTIQLQPSTGLAVPEAQTIK